MKNNHFDVIIIGAGPAGASCANELVKNGVKTLVIEKKKLPRYKCCAGLLNDNVQEFILENFEKIPSELKSVNQSLRITKNLKRFVELPINTICVERYKLDNWLIKKSKVKIIESSRYIKHYYSNGNIIIKTNNNFNEVEYSCSYLIGADGGYSSIRRQIDPDYILDNMLINKQLIYSGNSNIDNEYFNFVKNKKYSDAIAWLFLRNNLIHIGCSYLAKKNKDNNYLKLLFNDLSEEFHIKKCNLKKQIVCLSDSRGNENKFNFGDNNILLVGEACGLVSSLGEGIYQALHSGKQAALAIISSNNTIVEYKKRIQQEKEKILQSFEVIIS